MIWWVSRGWPRQLPVMNEKSRCSILFHLDVPGGKWRMISVRPVSSASRWSSLFHSRLRALLLPPLSAGDDQAVGGAATRFADIVPPTADRVDGEGGRVVIDPDAHPSAIGADVVDPVRDCLAQFRDQEIVGPHRFGLAPRAPGSTRILEVADQFLLLGVDRDSRLTLGQRRLDRLVEVLELGVAVGMVRSFAGSCGSPEGYSRRRATPRRCWYD